MQQTPSRLIADNGTNRCWWPREEMLVAIQGLPDAQTPENVLDLLDSLQTQLLKSTERLGELEGQHAEQTGERLTIY